MPVNKVAMVLWRGVLRGLGKGDYSDIPRKHDRRCKKTIDGFRQAQLWQRLTFVKKDPSPGHDYLP